jgi:hypothetical protein
VVESFFDTTAIVLTLGGPLAAATAAPPLSGEPELQPAVSNPNPAIATSIFRIAEPALR